MKVVTPIPLIINELNNTILSDYYTDAVFKFDPGLEYIDVMRGLRALRHSLDLESENVFPLFAFNRSNLNPVEGSRVHYPLGEISAEGSANNFIFRTCKFDLMMKIFHRDALWIDTFEVLYSCRSSINAIRTFTMTLPELGDFNYSVEWGELDSNEYVKMDNFYIAVSFIATITGPFLVMDDVPATVIKHIIANIRGYANYIFSEPSANPQIIEIIAEEE